MTETIQSIRNLSIGITLNDIIVRGLSGDPEFKTMCTVTDAVEVDLYITWEDNN